MYDYLVYICASAASDLPSMGNWQNTLISDAGVNFIVMKFMGTEHPLFFEESREEVVLGDVMREQMAAMLSDGEGPDWLICRQVCFYDSKTR